MPRTKKGGEAKRRRGSSAYDEALYYLTPKARTVREVENRLDECNYSEGEIMQTVERLIAAGLLNDEKYAHDFVSSRLATKPVSKRKLREQLAGHFIPGELIDAALAEVSDEAESENAFAVAEKYYRQFASLAEDERRRRVGLRLTSRGYGYDDIRAALERLSELCEEKEDCDDEYA